MNAAVRYGYCLCHPTSQPSLHAPRLLHHCGLADDTVQQRHGNLCPLHGSMQMLGSLLPKYPPTLER
eukprot:7440144-Pyramimonas_sp.AAC.1